MFVALVIQAPTFSRRHTKTYADSTRRHSERDCHRSTTTQLWNADMSTSDHVSRYLYITCIRKFYLLKKCILACCGYSPTSPFFLLLSEHKHSDNAATTEFEQWERWKQNGVKFAAKRGYKEKRKMSQVLGTFGQLDFTLFSPFSLGARF